MIPLPPAAPAASIRSTPRRRHHPRYDLLVGTLRKVFGSACNGDATMHYPNRKLAFVLKHACDASPVDSAL
eukprot:5464230-Pyramimonas_sp.AAC.1